MDKKIIFWIKWLGVLPLSLISGLLLSFPIHWVLYRSLFTLVKPYPKLPELLLQPFFSALVFVYVGYLLAPEYKFRTAFILVVLWTFGAGASFVLAYFNIQINSTEYSLTLGGLPILAGVIGALSGLYIVKSKGSLSN